MANINCSCNCRCSCTVAALIVSAIIGVLAAFLQITGMITVTPVFLWVVFGIGIVYLAVLVMTVPQEQEPGERRCLCGRLNLLLIGILGSILLAAVLLAVGIVATSVVSAILVGLLLFFFTLTLTGSACYVRCISNCTE